jgi:hypothetical protein
MEGCNVFTQELESEREGEEKVRGDSGERA